MKPGARVGLSSSTSSGSPGSSHEASEIADVGERVAEGADLPVEHRLHRTSLVDDRVAEPEVAVHDAALALLGDLGGEPIVHRSDRRGGRVCGSLRTARANA